MHADVRAQGVPPIATTSPRSVPIYTRSRTTAIAPGWPVTAWRHFGPGHNYLALPPAPTHAHRTIDSLIISMLSFPD